MTTCRNILWTPLSNVDGRKSTTAVRDSEREGYDLLITTDRNLKHQQNLANRQLAIVVLLSTSWPRMQRRIEDIRTAVDGAGPGDYVEVVV